ncbi:MAG TPA: phosphotransferase, partial [Myxococcota bacterium]|nr:phosphotransferase [Myxococcota bacterium]
MSESIPVPDEITAAWLGERLRAAGHPSAEVAGFTAKRIGTGQLGLCIRFALELAAGDADVPRSLVGKFPSDDPTSRQTAMTLRSYAKEVHFYRELQARLTIGTPRCYHAAIQGDGPEFVLLLEDLAPGEQGEQLAGTTPEVAHAAAMELVGLHAPTWGDVSLRGVEWLGEPSEATVQIGRALYAAQWPGFLERYGSHLAD